MSLEYDEVLARLAASLALKTKNRFPINTFCFKEQLEFINDESKFKTAVCGRRSGKTIACAADLLNTALTNEDVVCLYITLSRQNAKRIIWNELVKICKRYNIYYKPDNTELSMKFNSGSMIYLAGAKDSSSIDNFRGMALKKVYIDECQSFRPYIEELIEDVISKALYDHDGTLCLTGTPGPVPIGYFHDCAQSDSWSHHGWTMFQNSHLAIKSGKSHQELLDRDLERKGMSLDHPTIQREVFAKWATDPNALVFKYNPALNDYGALPVNTGRWSHVIGLDLGFDDADAIAVLGWNDYLKQVYLVEEIVTKKQTISSLVEQLGPIYEKYSPNRIVCDTGGLGKKIAQEISARWGIPVMPAEKTRKLEYIELLNDALRTKNFLARRNTKFAEDCMLLEWEFKPGGTRVVSDTYHSDITDAVLYAYRECLHWLSGPEPVKPVMGTQAHYDKEEKEHLNRVEEELRKQLNVQNSFDDPWSTNIDFER